MTFYLKGTDVADLDISRTIFLKYKSTAMDNEYIVGSDGVDGKRGWALLIIDNKLTFRNYHTTLAYNELESSTNIRDNMWHSIAITCNPTSNVYTLYIDGSSDQTGTFTEAHLVGIRVAVGLKYWRGNKYGLNSNSIIDSVRVFTVTKSSTEISNLHGYRPASNEVPRTEVKQTNLISEITFDSGHTTPIPVLPNRDIDKAVNINNIPVFQVQDIPIINTPAELQIEIADINVDNVAVLNFDVAKIDFNDLGITNIDLSEIDKIILPDIDTTIPNIEIDSIPTIEHTEVDDSDTEVQTPDIYVPPDPEDIPPTDTGTKDKPTTPSTRIPDDDRVFTAVDKGTVNYDAKSPFGVKDGVVLSFWFKVKSGESAVDLTGKGTMLFDYRQGRIQNREVGKEMWANTNFADDFTGTGASGYAQRIGRATNFHTSYKGINLQTPTIFNITGSGNTLFINYYGIAWVSVPYIRVKSWVVHQRSNGETSQFTKKNWHMGILYTTLPLFVKQSFFISMGSNNWVHFAVYLGRDEMRIAVDGSLTSNIQRNWNPYTLNEKYRLNRNLLTDGITDVGGTLVPLRYNSDAYKPTRNEAVIDNVLNRSGISIPQAHGVPNSVYPRPDLVYTSYRRQWIRKRGYVVNESSRLLYDGIKSSTGTILTTPQAINDEFGMFVWKSSVNFIPPNKISLSLGNSASANLMDDVRFYNGTAWSAQLVRDLYNG